MRVDLFHGTSSTTLALLRRAMTFHRDTPRSGGATAPAVRAATAGRILRRADPAARPSLTERHLAILGVGSAPDRAEPETGLEDVRR